jgi:hypothetical protein
MKENTMRTTINLIATILLLVCTAAIAMPAPEVGYSTGEPVEAWKSYGVVTLLALAGMLANFLRRWLTGQIAGSLIAYLFTDDPRRTGLAVFTLIGTVAAAIAAGQFDGVTLKQLFMPAFLLGYAADTLNKGANPQA